MTKSKAKVQGFSIDSIPEPENIEDIIYSMMINPNLSNMNYFNSFNEIEISPDSVRDEDTEDKNIVDLGSGLYRTIMGTHALHHYLKDNPQKATEILISKASRRMVCLGATPVAVSAFLYHLDYRDPFSQDITTGVNAGLENCARAFSLKIMEKKVRFDYFKNQGPAPVTIIISMIGKLETERSFVTHTLKRKGNNIFCLGDSSDDVCASEYIEFYHGIPESGLQEFNLESELIIQNAVKELNDKKILSSASPVGKGGLFFTLFRAAVPNEFGFDITSAAEVRIDSFLFGESMGRIIVDVDPENEDAFVDYLSEKNIPFFTLGHVTKGEIRIDDISLGYIDKIIPGA
jgi:phosphoribosylformylglycinamidine synthase